MSTLPLAKRRKDPPRWSVSSAVQPAGLPTPSAGLVPAGNMVSVSPPLLANAPNCALSGTPDVPTKLPLTPLANPTDPLELPIRLLPPSANVPNTSWEPPKKALPATIVLVSVQVPLEQRIPPPCPFELLPEIVTFFTTRLPVVLKMAPPPPLPLILPASVLLV